MAKRFLYVPFEVKTDSILDDGTFEGYASTFGGNPDSHGDIVVKGAFKNSIQRGGRNKTGIAMLWQHDSDSPIGKWLQLSEDESGLGVVGKLTRGVSKAEDAYLLLKDQAIQHFSIGYDLERDEKGKPLDNSYSRDNDTGIRYLKALELWEISLVTFPANVNAAVVNVKDIEDAKTPRELEDILREANMSKEAAKYVVKLASPSLREAVDNTGKLSDKGLDNILSSLRQVNFSLRLSREIHS